MEGNKEIIFQVSENDVLKRIFVNSYYRGERIKEEDGVHAARMQAGDDNTDIIRDETSMAARDVAAIITRNLGRCILAYPQKDEDIITFTTMAASNFPDELKTTVEELISSYLFDKALEGWLLINMPSEVEKLAQRNVADAEKLRQVLVERGKPER